MWNMLVEYMTDWLMVSCTILAFVIPFSVYKINIYLHEYGDPPWKKDSLKDEE